MIKAPCETCGKVGWHRNYVRNKNFDKLTVHMRQEDNTTIPVTMRLYRDRIDGPFECKKHRPGPTKAIHPKRNKKKGFSKGKKQK